MNHNYIKKLAILPLILLFINVVIIPSFNDILIDKFYLLHKKVNNLPPLENSYININ